MAQRLTQPRDRGKAVPLRGQRQAVCQPDLLQAPYRGRHPNQAKAAVRAALSKRPNLWLMVISPTSTVQCLYGGFFMLVWILPRKEDIPLNRRYLTAVTPLADHVLQVDFVSGSRLLLDMKPYLDKIRFRPAGRPAGVGQRRDQRHLRPLRQCGAEPRRDAVHGGAGALRPIKRTEKEKRTMKIWKKYLSPDAVPGPVPVPGRLRRHRNGR